MIDDVDNDKELAAEKGVVEGAQDAEIADASDTTVAPRKALGGRRPGAGRPKGSGSFTEVKSVRMQPAEAEFCRQHGGNAFLRSLLQNAMARAELPKLASDVTVLGPVPVEPDQSRNIRRVEMNGACGFPSPATDFADEEFNLNDYFVRQPVATFVIKASGESMADAGIMPGDILIVDRSVKPRSGDIVLAYFDGGLTVKRIELLEGGGVELHPDNKNGEYKTLYPLRYDDFRVEGVVTGMGRRF